MLNRHFNPQQPYRAVAYLRMSSDLQNPRSPDQQLAEINKRLAALGLPWKVVKVYRDEGISGRLVRKRPDYQRMLQDIKTGDLQVDLILVDTVERFGRVDDLPSIRKGLYEKHGVLVLTADSNFADPHTPQGKALGMFEAMRATEDGRIKAHNVLRGKRDTAQRGRWPGGPPPFGYKLESVMKEAKGRQEVDYCKLVRDPETDWIIALLFNKAFESGFGQTRLARFLNEHPDIPAKFKPFKHTSIAYWLESRIYCGELVWAQHCTGIVDDMRVTEPNREEDIIRVPNFCEPIVSREVQDAILKLRTARSERILQSRQRNARGTEGKLIEPPAPGMTLKYLLSGLVRCGHCQRSMVPNSSAPFVTQSGESHTYTAYVCPASGSEVCCNKRRIPEEWLRKVVIETLRKRLFPEAEAGHDAPAWLEPLMKEVRQEMERLTTCQHDQRPGWEQELGDIQEKVAGWSLSLANPKLPSELRAALEIEWAEALQRKQILEGSLLQNEQQDRRIDTFLSPAQVRERLDRLDAVLARNNPTLGNMELSMYIDRIDCFDDGRVVLRTCKLGALGGVTDLLAEDAPRPTASSDSAEEKSRLGTPRRRARLRIDDGGERGSDLSAAVDLAADPHRFSGLAEEWFWTDVFQIHRRKSWAEEHAADVAAARASGLTMSQLAEKFGKTIPTIRAALRYAASVDESVAKMPQKMPRRRWHEDHAGEVAAKKAEGLGTSALAAHFGKSDTTIRAALEYAHKAGEVDSDEAHEVLAPLAT